MHLTTLQFALLSQWIVVALIVASCCDWNPPYYVNLTRRDKVKKALYCAFWPLVVLGFFTLVFWEYGLAYYRQSRFATPSAS